MTGFQGFPSAALDFYDDLEIDNTKSFWEAHKAVYADSVKAPMVALTEALAPEFGAAKIFRPYRDVRFAKDKTPYKTHQGAYVAVAPATGWYVEVERPRCAGGLGFLPRGGSGPGPDPRRHRRRAHRHRAREAADSPCERKGFELGGDRLKTTPRGYDADHPRIDLLRHKSMTLGKSYGFEPVIHTA